MRWSKRCHRGTESSTVGTGRRRLARSCLQLLRAERSTDAKQLLRWVFAEQRRDIGLFDPLSGTPFARFWLAHRHDGDLLELSAAMLAADSSAAETALVILQAAEPSPDDQRLVDMAICAAHISLDRLDAVAAVAAKYDQPPWRDAFAFSALGQFARRGDTDGLRERLAMIDDKQSRLLGLSILHGVLMTAGNFDEGREVFELLRQEELPAFLKTRVAWSCMFEEQLSADAIAMATEAIREIDFENRDWVQDLRSAYGPYALALIEQGKLQEAAQTLPNIPSVPSQRRPTPRDLCIQARIAEACGFVDHARDLYGQIAPDKIWSLSVSA